jgi:hypothetical protein
MPIAQDSSALINLARQNPEGTLLELGTWDRQRKDQKPEVLDDAQRDRLLPSRNSRRRIRQEPPRLTQTSTPLPT